MRPPVAVALADVGRVRDLEEAASVRVDRVEVALSLPVAAEEIFFPVRRPDRMKQPNVVGSENGPPQGPGDRDCRSPLPSEWTTQIELWR